MESDKGSFCMINDKVLHSGDSIDGFKVVRIKSRFVELMSEGVKIVLKMTE